MESLQVSHVLNVILVEALQVSHVLGVIPVDALQVSRVLGCILVEALQVIHVLGVILVDALQVSLVLGCILVEALQVFTLHILRMSITTCKMCVKLLKVFCLTNCLHPYLLLWYAVVQYLCVYPRTTMMD